MALLSDNRTPKPGDLYRHFKGNLYQIITVATHTETEEPLVVYQALYGDYKTYARPFNMFLEEVDRVKYPQVTQLYRFEKINRDSLIVSKDLDQNSGKETTNEETNNKEYSPSLSETGHSIAGKTNVEDQVASDANSELELINKDLLAFLDAETYQDKLEILFAIRNKIDDRLMTDIEMSLDLSGHEGSMDDRFLLVKNNLETRAKFESKRLR